MNPPAGVVVKDYDAVEDEAKAAKAAKAGAKAAKAGGLAQGVTSDMDDEIEKWINPDGYHPQISTQEDFNQADYVAKLAYDRYSKTDDWDQFYSNYNSFLTRYSSYTSPGGVSWVGRF